MGTNNKKTTGKAKSQKNIHQKTAVKQASNFSFDVVSFSELNKLETIESIKNCAKTHIALAGENVLNASEQFQLNKNLLSQNKVLIPSILNKNDEHKSKGLQWWVQSKMNVLSTLFSPLQAKNLHHNLSFWPKDLLLKILESNSKNEDFFRFHQDAAHRGIEFIEGKAKRTSKIDYPIKKAFKDFGSIIKSKFNWFFKEPFAHGFPKGDSLYRFIFASISLVLLVVLPYLSQDYAITWDEPDHVDMAKKTVNYYASFGSDEGLDKLFEKRQELRFYGSSFDTIAEFFHRNLFSFSDIYKFRHLLNSLVGLILILCAGLLAKFFSNWRGAVITVLIIVASSSFFGHIFNNNKDIPFAAGYILALASMIRFFSAFPKHKRSDEWFMILGIGFAISIRPPGFILLAFFGLFFFLFWILKSKAKIKKIIPFLKKFIVVGVISYVLGILLWPYGLENPFSNPIKAISELSNFDFLKYYELFEGNRIFDKPAHYIPKYILITAPLVLFFGLLFWALHLLIDKPLKTKGFAYFMLVFAIIFPLVYAIYKDSYVYNGWRHFLFIYPPLAIMAGVGFTALNHRKIFNIALTIIALVLVGKEYIWSSKNHPYQYMYFNEFVGGVKGAAGQYELDYWCQTAKEGAEYIFDNFKQDGKKFKIASNQFPNGVAHYLKASNNEDYFKFDWLREYEWTKSNSTYSLITPRTLSSNQYFEPYWPPKNTLKTIDVGGYPVGVISQWDNEEGASAYNYLYTKNRPDSAALLYEQAFSKNPYEEEYARGLGLSYLYTGRDSLAEIYLRKAIQLRKGNYNANFGMANLYFNMFQQIKREKKDISKNLFLLDSSIKYSKKSVEQKANNLQAYNILGNSYLESNQLKKAEDIFKKSIDIYKGFDNGYYGLAQIYMSLQQANKAIDVLQECLKYSRNPNTFYYLASAYQAIGDQKNAQAYMKQYQQLINQKR